MWQLLTLLRGTTDQHWLDGEDKSDSNLAKKKKEKKEQYAPVPFDNLFLSIDKSEQI